MRTRSTEEVREMREIVILRGVAAACGALVLGGALRAAAQEAPASPSAKVDRKAFSNTWKLNPDQSEKLRDKLRPARGGGPDRRRRGRGRKARDDAAARRAAGDPHDQAGRRRLPRRRRHRADPPPLSRWPHDE